MTSPNSRTNEQEVLDLQRVFGVVPLPMRGLARAAQDEATTEAGVQALT